MMNDYPAPGSENSQFASSWGTGQNDYTFPSQEQQRSSPYFQSQPGYQPPPTGYGQYGQQSGYQPQSGPYAPLLYSQQQQYVPVVPVVPVVAMYDPYGGQALAGMIIGIIALVLPIFWIMPVLGIIFSALGMRSTTRKGMATAGLVCSIVAIATAFCWFPFFFI